MPRSDITRPSQDVRRMLITVTSRRIFGWCWTWRCKRGIRRRHCMRNRNCGHFWTGLTEQDRPVFLRGDSHWGAEKAMVGAEERKLGYLFKLKQSVNVKKLIGQIFGKEEWVEAGQQWQGREDLLRLSGWTKERRVVVLRRPVKSKPAAEAETLDKKKSKRRAAKQLTLDLLEMTYQGVPYEYVVLVTSLADEVRTIAQHYRDRGDAENNFDELKNQWGWAG